MTFKNCKEVQTFLESTLKVSFPEARFLGEENGEDLFREEYTKGLLRSVPRLNEKESQRLIAIEGTPVDMLNPPAGCPFAPRCPKCMKICLREMPPYTDFSEIHSSACWLNQKEEYENSGKENG